MSDSTETQPSRSGKSALGGLLLAAILALIVAAPVAFWWQENRAARTPALPPLAEYRVRHAVEFELSPEPVEIYLDGRRLGAASFGVGQDGRSLVFAGPGEHYARFERAGFRTVWAKIAVSPDAPVDEALIRVRLEAIRE